MSTARLYYDDSYIKEFTANVMEIRPYENGRYAVLLDRSAFYPESGGQPCDKGRIDGIEVLDIIDYGSEILHIMAAAPAAKQIHASVDWYRRFDHMQQHSGQHILSAAAYQITSAETVGFHLGAASSQIDLTLDTLTREQAEQIEHTANKTVFSNIQITTHYASKSTLAQFPVRKQPPAEVENIRLIELPGIDCCPCGGTHVRNSGEIGLIKIRSWERKKGLVRIDFVCGGRALADYQLITYSVNDLSARFSVPVTELLPAVDKHFAKDEQIEKQLNQAKQDLSDFLAKELLTTSEMYNDVRLIHYLLPSAQPQEVSDLAKRLAANERVIALIGGVNPDQTKCHLVFASAAGTKINMGEQLKAVLPLIQGKGGGNPQSAQGGGSDASRAEEALAKAKQNIVASL